jgi:hypothetical protein
MVGVADVDRLLCQRARPCHGELGAEGTFPKRVPATPNSPWHAGRRRRDRRPRNVTGIEDMWPTRDNEDNALGGDGTDCVHGNLVRS